MKLIWLPVCLLLAGNLFGQSAGTLISKDPELKWMISQARQDFYLSKSQADSLAIRMFYFRIKARKSGKSRQGRPALAEADSLVVGMLKPDQQQEYRRMLSLRPTDRKYWKYDWFR